MAQSALRCDQFAARPHGSWRKHRRAAVASLLAIATLFGLSGVASASPAPPPEPTVIADGLAGPLSLATTNRGLLVSQTFSGIASQVARNGKVTDLFSDPQGVEGATPGPFGTIVYGSRLGDEESFQGSFLKVRTPWGNTKVLADIGAYETAHNPDASNSYGVQGISDDCAAQWPVADFGPANYSGGIDSHVYKLAVSLFGVYIADAGANAIFFVSWTGRVHTVAVLPPQAVQLPPDPTVMGLPACVAGLTYNFEPVPTDIELTGWTSALVSLLPGGPEDASLGARGSVVKLNLWTGNTKVVAKDLAGATDLTIGNRGRIFVTELFGNKVSEITRHGVRTVAELPSPGAIVWTRGRLYVAYDAFASGKIGAIKP
ncbi:MAG: ScyD/ScyE family protein [Microthrixaceae bacterium]